MAEVIKDLLIGDQASVQTTSGIKFLLSVVNYKPEVPKGVKSLHINIEDAEDVNLLEHLPKCMKFISKALSAEAPVLVHCNAGTSRSVSVVTAYLMAEIGLPLQDALNTVKASAPSAAPNSGFMAQLQLWEDMGCRLNERNPAYKRFKLEQVGKKWQQDGYVDPTTLPKLPEDKGPTSMEIPEGGLYRCRKCRQLLATASHIIPMEAHQGKKGFRNYQAVKGHVVVEGAEQVVEEGGDESSLFVQPMAWMGEAVMGVVQGKLYCPGCSARLGSFNWSGIRDTSGAWVTPAFQLHVGKMDHVLRRPPEALNGIRRPILLPSSSASSQSAAQLNLRPPVIPLSRQRAAGQGTVAQPPAQNER